MTIVTVTRIQPDPISKILISGSPHHEAGRHRAPQTKEGQQP